MSVCRYNHPFRCIFDSDRVVQYAATAYREKLQFYDMLQSISHKDPYNNTVAENLFGCLKCELIHLKQYPSRNTAQTDILLISRLFIILLDLIPLWVDYLFLSLKPSSLLLMSLKLFRFILLISVQSFSRFLCEFFWKVSPFDTLDFSQIISFINYAH